MACEAPGGGAGHAWLLLRSWLLHLALVWQAWCPWGMGWFSLSMLLLSPALGSLVARMSSPAFPGSGYAIPENPVLFQLSEDHEL